MGFEISIYSPTISMARLYILIFENVLKLYIVKNKNANH